MARLYADTGFSRRRLEMLEVDANDALNCGRKLDALRILSIALVMNPHQEGSIRNLAQELVAERWNLKVSEELAAHEVGDLVAAKMELFADYVMQSIDRGSFSRACAPR